MLIDTGSSVSIVRENAWWEATHTVKWEFSLSPPQQSTLQKVSSWIPVEQVMLLKSMTSQQRSVYWYPRI